MWQLMCGHAVKPAGHANHIMGCCRAGHLCRGHCTRQAKWKMASGKHPGTWNLVHSQTVPAIHEGHQLGPHALGFPEEDVDADLHSQADSGWLRLSVDAAG